jgi:hypothetical protein
MRPSRGKPGKGPRRLTIRFGGLTALGAYGLVVIAALLLPETKGRELTADA